MKTLRSSLDALAGFVRGTVHFNAALPAGRVACDSRLCGKNSLFVAVKGVGVDGSNFIGAAVAAGATAVVAEEAHPELPPEISQIVVSDSRMALAILAREELARPDEALKLIGVTGTNGKTTSAYLAAQLLSFERCGLISTVESFDGAERKCARQTTPEPLELFRLFRSMADHKLKYCAMELSSHALDQRRVGNIRFAGAIFTNLTGDHLDYHKTTENYFRAKQRLFLESLAIAGCAVVNSDDPYGRKLLKLLEQEKRQYISFGFGNDAMCRVRNCRCDAAGSTFTLNGIHFTTPLTGEFNVMNLSGVLLTLARLTQKPLSTFAPTAARAVGAPGRLERLRREHPATDFYVDYAHTDDALAKVLAALRPVTRGRLICLFGCGGDRDRTKRPRMALAAAQHADLVIVTSDNPRSEEPMAVIDEIIGGMPPGADYRIEPDRATAIAMAVGIAGEGDTVLVAGKGHENYQIIGGDRRDFDDRREIAARI